MVEVWSTGRAMAYGYDDANQLTSVSAARPSDAARYHYDAAGNPVDRAELGLDVTNSFNNLNQIVTGSWTGSTVTVAGSVNYPIGSISVNNTPGTVYPDSSFDVAGVPVVPGTNTLTATYTGPAFTNVPMTATDTSTVVLGDTAYTHDANGNLTSDATFLYQYDTANQLTNVVRKADNTRVLQCRYDALGRRVEAIRADGTVDRYVFFPGSFLVLAILDGNNVPKELYTRGPDLSGSLDAAGGIGGILACTYSNAPTAPLYHHADLMGNVITLTDAAATIASAFCYTAYGQLFAYIGTIIPRHAANSKESEFESACVYYGYRYYSVILGRWMSRDPIESEAILWAYTFVANNPLDGVDSWGDVLQSGRSRFRFGRHRRALIHKQRRKRSLWNIWRLMKTAKQRFEKEIDPNYECCWKGNWTYKVHDWDDPDNPSVGYHVLHRQMGCTLKKAVVTYSQLKLLNIGYESAWSLREIPSKMWEELKAGKGWNAFPDGYEDWLDDTFLDMAAVYEGWMDGDGNCMTKFIPSNCRPK